MSTEIEMIPALKRTSRGMTMGCPSQAHGTRTLGTGFMFSEQKLNLDLVKQHYSSGRILVVSKL